MPIDCLLDTNSILKRYHNEPGTEIIDYLFDKSPTAIINLLNIQVAETIKTFYTLRARNIIQSDDVRKTLIDTFLKDIYDGANNGRIRLYDFANEHLKDLEVYEPIQKAARPKISFWDAGLKRFVKRKKERADTVDTLMLIIMREMHYHTQESYLVSSDEHVLNVAKLFNLRTINPETTKKTALPPSLDARQNKRIPTQLKAICRDSATSQPLGSTTTLDFCNSGMCVRFLTNLTDRRNVTTRISPLNRDEPTIVKSGEVRWTNNRANGIRFFEPIPDDCCSQLIQN